MGERGGKICKTGIVAMTALKTQVSLMLNFHKAQ